jgi:hypothetical protein
MTKSKNNPLCSIVIVSFNTKDVLRDCLESLKKVEREIDFEVIVSDNGSTDGTVEMIKKSFKQEKLLENKKNLGFSKGNNAARKVVKGKYILFLNSDTVVPKNTLSKCVEYLENNEDVGAMTCKIVLPNGKLDRDTRRSFPTPFVALTHFSGLDRLFPKSKLLGKYWYSYMDENIEHEVDVIQGAFHLTRKEILDKANWFDEDYFLDGEDIDLCFRIKELGYKIMYYPKVKIVHVKKASKKKSKSSLRVTSGVRAMEIFYRKRLWSNYPIYINYLVLFGIKVLLVVRLVKHETLSFWSEKMSDRISN